MSATATGSQGRDIFKIDDIRCFLEKKAEKYNRPEFIEDDPIQVPHLFTQPENIEISGFLTATIAWGADGCAQGIRPARSCQV